MRPSAPTLTTLLIGRLQNRPEGYNLAVRQHWESSLSKIQHGDRVQFETIEGHFEAEIDLSNGSRFQLSNISCKRASGRLQSEQPLLIAHLKVIVR